MNHAFVAERLIRRIEQLEQIADRQEVRMNNFIREARVKEVDYENGTAIVDAQGVESFSVPWLEQAGDVVEWNPITAGQRVMLFSPSGDMSRAFIMPGGFTDDVPQPHNKGGEKRVKIGDCVITQSASGLTFEIGGTKYEFTGDGFTQTGGKQKHDGKDVGSTHIHGGVAPGGSTTDVPAN